MKWWPRKRIAPSTEDEAKQHLESLCAQDEQVDQLAERLREVQVRNHFSQMVTAAITRTAREGH